MNFLRLLIEIFIATNSMIKTYLKQIISSIKKTPANFIINLIGLSIGMAVFLLIMSYVISELSVNKNITNYTRIYRISRGDGTAYQGTPARLGEIIYASLPEVISFTRIDPGGSNHVLKINGTPYKPGSLVYADSTLFRIFDLPFKYGDPYSCMDSEFSLVITESVCNWLFPGENPVGNVIKLDGKYDVKITGVVFDPGSQTHIRGDMFISFHSLPVILNRPDLYDCYTCYNYETYLVFGHDNDRFEIIERINDLLDSYGSENSINSLVEDSYTITNLDAVYFGKEERPSFRKGNMTQLRFLSSLAILILIIGVINYINLATAHGSSRIHQMALRKVLGAKRQNLYIPVLGEAILISLISVGLGFLLMKLVAPYFIEIFNSEMDLYIIKGSELVVLLLSAAILTGLVAGIWPAVVITRFDTGKSLHNIIANHASGGHTRRILTVFQIMVSVVLIGCTWIIYSQLRYIHNSELGFDKEILIYMPVNSEIIARKNAFRSELLKHSSIENISFSYASYRTSNERWGFEYEDRDVLLHIEAVDEHYIKTLGLNLIEGREFRGEQDQGKLIINQAAMRTYFGETPVGIMIESLRDGTEIIGVVEDFRFLTFDREVEPIGLIYRPEWSSLCNVRLSGTNISAALTHMEKVWNEFCLEYPYEYHFVDKLYEDRYMKEKNMAGLMAFFSLISVFIAALGVYGLSVYNVMKRAKEIGIRKMTGASVTDVLKNLTSDLNKIVLISIIPAFIIMYIFMKQWLAGFAYHISIPLLVYPLSALIVWLVSSMSTMMKTVKTAGINPVSVLRTE